MGSDIGALLDKKEIKFEMLSGRKIAIDAYNTIYQFLSIIRQPDGTPLMDGKGRITSHLSGLFYRNIRLLEFGIEPIFVFDGEPPSFKQKTIEARSLAKEEAERKLKEAKERGEEELKIYAQATVRMTEEIVEESKKILTLLGIPIVQAPSEGEAQAAQLTKDGIAYAVGSQDYDSLLFGGKKLVRNLTISGKRKLPKKGIYINVEPEIIDLNETLNKLGIDIRRLIWVAIMVGTDYNEGIKGIGPKKGLIIAKKANSLKECFELANANADGNLDAKYSSELEDIEKFYLNPKVKSFEKEMEEITKVKEIQKDKIIDFLCGEHDFMLERVENALEKINNKNKKGGQSKLESWF